MAITIVDDLTEGFNVNPSTLTTNPAATGDLLVTLVGVKPSTRSTSPPAGWTDHSYQIGGTGTAGTDTGDARIYCWHRVVDGTEPGSSSLTWSGSPNPTIHSMLQLHKTRGAAEDWDLAVAFGNDSTQSTGTDAVDATAASDPGYTTGDLIVVGLFVPTDNGVFSNPDIVIPGCTVTGVTNAVSYGTALGNDGGMQVWIGRVTAGTSTGAPVVHVDVDVANASAGPLVFLRIREPAAPSLGELAVFDGSDWLPGEMVVYDGSAWA